MEILYGLTKIYDSIYQGTLAHILTAVLIVFLGIIFGRLAGGLVSKLLHELEIKKLVQNVVTFHKFEDTVSGIITTGVIFIGIILALKILGLASYFLYFIAFLLLLLIGLISILAVKDFFPNFFSGSYLREQKIFSKYDTIHFRSITGKVTNMGIVHLVLETEKGDLLHIPYSLLAHEKVKNLTRKN